jgi:LAS superfamily LD-carboxypeptidase LdcB
MKYIFSLLILCMSVSSLVYAEEILYALPKGPVYVHIGLASPKLREKFLKYGDRLQVEGQSVHGSFTWYFCSMDSSRFYLPEAFVVKEPKGIPFDGEGNIPIGKERVDKWHSLPLGYIPTDLIPVPEECRAPGYERRELLLRKEAALVFMKMIQDAKTEGVDIRILSAFRDARYQSALYSGALRRLGLFQSGVAKPGHSEHQLGTTCDLTTNEIGNQLSTNFEKTQAYEWLQDRMFLYGIFLTYPKLRGKAMGYMYEPWHFRYWGTGRWEHMKRSYGLFLLR